MLRVVVPWALFCLAVLAGPAAIAAPAEAIPIDRVAVRFIAPETGGAAHPRFLTERELAFFARLEALFELGVQQTSGETNDYPERYVRVAADRLVARAVLAGLVIQRGVEPPELPRLALEARSELEARLGGPQVLAEAMRVEGIDDEELASFLRDQVRAGYYLDRAVSPIPSVSEDALREAYRSMLHPFRGSKFDDVRQKLRRWLVTERLRAAEIEFLQGARARIRITTVRAEAPRAPEARGGS